MIGFPWMRIVVLLHFQLCQLRMLTAAAHCHVIHYNSGSMMHCPGLLQGQERTSPRPALTTLTSKLISQQSVVQQMWGVGPVKFKNYYLPQQFLPFANGCFCSLSHWKPSCAYTGKDASASVTWLLLSLLNYYSAP